MAKRILPVASVTFAMVGMFFAMMSMPSECTCSAPFCLPRPTVIILQGPLSIGPRKALWGFKRQERMTPSDS